MLRWSLWCLQLPQTAPSFVLRSVRQDTGQTHRPFFTAKRFGIKFTYAPSSINRSSGRPFFLLNRTITRFAKTILLSGGGGAIEFPPSHAHVFRLLAISSITFLSSLFVELSHCIFFSTQALNETKRRGCMNGIPGPIDHQLIPQHSH